MNIGDYVRTSAGEIGKIIECPEDFKESYGKMLWIETIDEQRPTTKKYIIKSSPNIIDLIKKKDILVDYADNIYKVVKVWKGYVFTDKKNEYGQTITLVDYQIKSILTHEMFESMEYKIGDKDE